MPVIETPSLRIPKDTPELFYPISLDDALMAKVKYHNVRKSLGWIARNRPLQLEDMMNDTKMLGTPEYWALCVVYEAYEVRVRKAVEGRDRHGQMLTLRGLRRSKRRNRAAAA